MRILSRLGLQYRIAGGVVVGLIGLSSLFGFLALQAINESKDVALDERLRLAESTAESVDALVRHTVRQLEAAAQVSMYFGEDTEREQLARQYEILGTFETLVRLDLDGRVLWTVPESANEPDWATSGSADILEALRGRETSIVQVAGADLDHPPVAVVVTPVHGTSGDDRGFLAGELHLSHAGAPLLPLPQGEEQIHAEVVDSEGFILAHSAVDESHTQDEHVGVLRSFIANRRQGTAIHDDGNGDDHVIAYYPLESLPGGVVVEQLEDEALALPRAMERTVLIFGIGALVIGSGAAWLHARTVVRPIQQLTKASERIAAGELDEPVTSGRGDEVGVLASRFDQMRSSLKAWQEESRRGHEELEQRVRERTRELEALNQSRTELLGKVISAQEEERQRIARELHDDSAQALAALLVDLQSAAETLPPQAESAKTSLARVRAKTQRALADMRQIILDLRPSALDDLGLVAAVRWYARSRLEQLGATVAVHTKEEQRRLPGPLETALFRIAQEAINNVAKHADASNVTVRLEFTDDRASLLVQDDGKGFDVDGMTGSEGRPTQLGIVGMTERAALLGGIASIDSHPGGGTRVQVEVPLRGPSDSDERGR